MHNVIAALIKGMRPTLVNFLSSCNTFKINHYSVYSVFNSIHRNKGHFLCYITLQNDLSDGSMMSRKVKNYISKKIHFNHYHIVLIMNFRGHPEKLFH